MRSISSVSSARHKVTIGKSRSRHIPSTILNSVTPRRTWRTTWKSEGGANAAITQFFFNPDAYFHFVDQTRQLGAEVPVVPGIMPFHNFSRIAPFAARDGIEIPRWVSLKMEGYMDDAASIRAFGLDVVTTLCERLLAGGAPGLHFYTMNQSALTLEICRRLGFCRRQPDDQPPYTCVQAVLNAFFLLLGVHEEVGCRHCIGSGLGGCLCRHHIRRRQTGGPALAGSLGPSGRPHRCRARRGPPVQRGGSWARASM